MAEWNPGVIGTTILKQVGKFNEARFADSRMLLPNCSLTP
jgi:hypothetical protein